MLKLLDLNCVICRIFPFCACHSSSETFSSEALVSYIFAADHQISCSHLGSSVDAGIILKNRVAISPMMFNVAVLICHFCLMVSSHNSFASWLFWLNALVV
jgi:hypothetical protein